VTRDWVFYPKPIHLKEVEGAFAEFFNTTDLATLSQAFVREAFQNSIDGAAGDGPVRIRLFLSGRSRALKSATAQKYFGSFFDHARACERLQADWIGIEKGDCEYIVFEDFNTVGLSGDETVSEGGDDGNHFYHFFRTVGRSGKDSGNRLGRWGIGKYVFVMASQVKALFGYTVRSVSTPSSQPSLLLGQSSLEFHSIRGTRFMNEGWFGNCGNSALPAMPIGDPTEISEFEKDWNLTRGGERGLSIIVPYAVQFDENDLLFAVVHEYLGRILTGGLNIELDLPSRLTPLHVTALTIESIIREALQSGTSGSANWQRTLDELKSLEKLLNLPADQTLELPTREDVPFWSKRLPEDELADATSELAKFVVSARDSLDRDGFVRIRCNGSIKKRAKTGHAQRSFFDVFISKTEIQGERLYPVFWRTWLRISGRRMGVASRGYRTMLLADDDAISELLGDAEGPAHTEWSHKRPKFLKKQYEYGPEWLTFVRGAPSTLTQLLVGAIRETDDESLEPFFPVPDDGYGDGGDGSGDSGGGKPRGRGGGGGGGGGEIPPSSRAVMEAVGIGDGFKLRPVLRRPGTVPPIPKSKKFLIRVAYATARGDAYSRWSPNDFDLKVLVAKAIRTKKVKGCTATVSDMRPNEVTVVVDKTIKDLRKVVFEVVGFGQTRDLEVRVDVIPK
jgi:hypothetical protein